MMPSRKDYDALKVKLANLEKEVRRLTQTLETWEVQRSNLPLSHQEKNRISIKTFVKPSIDTQLKRGLPTVVPPLSTEEVKLNLKTNNQLIETDLCREQKNKNLLKFYDQQEDELLLKFFNAFPNFMLVEPADAHLSDAHYILEKNPQLKEILSTMKSVKPRTGRIIQNDKTNDFSYISQQLDEYLHNQAFSDKTFSLNTKESIYQPEQQALFKKYDIILDLEKPLREILPSSRYVIKQHKEELKGRTILNPRGKPIAFLAQKFQGPLNFLFAHNFHKRPKLSQTYSAFHSHPKILDYLGKNSSRVVASRWDFENCFNTIDLKILKQSLLSLNMPENLKINGVVIHDYRNFVDEVLLVATAAQFVDRRGKVFEQRNGLCLGGKLSPILCEINNEAMIQILLRDNPSFARELTIIRTVDDIVIFSKDERTKHLHQEFIDKLKKISNQNVTIEEAPNMDSIFFLGIRYNLNNSSATYKFKETTFLLLPSWFSMNSTFNKKQKFKGMIYYLQLFTTDRNILLRQKQLVDSILIQKDYPQSFIDECWEEVRLSLLENNRENWKPLIFAEEKEQNTNFVSNLFALMSKPSNWILNKWLDIFNIKNSKQKSQDLSLKEKLAKPLI